MDRYVLVHKNKKKEKEEERPTNVSPTKRRREEEDEEEEKAGGGGEGSASVAQKKARKTKAKGKEKASEFEHEHEHEDEHEVEEEEHTMTTTGVAKTVLVSANKKKKKKKKENKTVATLPAGVVAKWADDGGVEGMEAVRLLDGGLFRRHPQFIEPDEAARIFAGLMRDIPWLQSDIRVYGKTYKYADDDVVASTYLKTRPTPWSDDMRALRQRLERTLGCRFNYLLLNLYRDGRDHISFHADREAIAEGKGVIGSLSLGAERRFVLRHTATKAKLEFAMPSGSLMVMDGRTQESWQHAVPKQARVTQPRINLTFRIS